MVLRLLKLSHVCYPLFTAYKCFVKPEQEAHTSPQVEARLVDIRNAYGLLLWHFKDNIGNSFLENLSKRSHIIMLNDDYHTFTINAVYWEISLKYGKSLSLVDF